MRRFLLVVLLALMVASPVSAISPSWGDMSTLKGIKTVCVEVNVIGDATQASLYEVTSSSLKSRVEAKLKEAGISVAPLNKCKQMPGSPFLQVTASVFLWPGAEANFFVLADFNYLQEISLVRNNENKALVPTWSSGEFSTPPKKSLWGVVMGTVDSLVKEFAEDYFAVNR